MCARFFNKFFYRFFFFHSSGANLDKNYIYFIFEQKEFIRKIPTFVIIKRASKCSRGLLKFSGFQIVPIFQTKFDSKLSKIGNTENFPEWGINIPLQKNTTSA